MKKLVFILSLLTISAYSYAQTFSFGPKACINVSNYSGGNINSDAKVGYHLGGALNFGFGQVFLFSPRYFFQPKGPKVKMPEARRFLELTI